MRVDNLTSTQVRRFAHELVDASVKADNDALDCIVADLDLGDDPVDIANKERAIVAKYASIHDSRRIQDLYERVERSVQGAVERQPLILPPPPGPVPPKPTRNLTPSAHTAILAFLVPLFGGAYFWQKECRERELSFRESYDSWLKALDAKASEWREHNAAVKSLVESALAKALETGLEDANRELGRG